MLSIAVGGGSGPDPSRRNGEKAGYVVQGRIELRIAEQRYLLGEGDAFQFDSRQPHSFQNLADIETRLIWIIRSSEAV